MKKFKKLLSVMQGALRYNSKFAKVMLGLVLREWHDSD